jgi:hypothetical protein
MRPRGWLFCFHYSPAIAQIALSKALSLSELDYFCTLHNETLLQPFNVFYESKQRILLKTNFSIYTADISQVIEPK